MEFKNTYDANHLSGATTNRLMPKPDLIDDFFIAQLNTLLRIAAENARYLIGAHQSAVAIIIDQDWDQVRKVFSLSEKYAEWRNYDAPARGLGTHNWMLRQTQTVRYTQAELEQHPYWKNFGIERSSHPPMRGWLASPILDSKGKNWGLIQLSDKYEGDFSKDDEEQFSQYTQSLCIAIEALWQVRNLRKLLL